MTGARTVGTRRRTDLILAALGDAEYPLTTQQVAQKIGDHYSRVYAALRTLCGSRTMPYAACTGAVNAPGFPVIWHSWTDPDRGAYVCWSITDEERARRRSELAMLEEWACSPDQPSGGDS